MTLPELAFDSNPIGAQLNNGYHYTVTENLTDRSKLSGSGISVDNWYILDSCIIIVILLNLVGYQLMTVYEIEKENCKWTIPLKEAASLLWYFYRDTLRSLTLLSLNVLSQKS